MSGQAVNSAVRPAALRCAIPVFSVLLAGGCATPFGDAPPDPTFDHVVERAVREEVDTINGTAGADGRRTTRRDASDVEATLADRRDELDALSPAMSPTATVELGSDLLGAETRTVSITLDEAVRRAIDQNLGIRRAQLQPAINEEDVIVAEAIFDYTLYANANLTRTDQPTTTPVLNGTPIGSPVTYRDTYVFDTGVRRTMTTGGTVTLSTDVTRIQNNAPGLSLAPDPAYLAAVRLGLTQPLLRGFGRDVNRASIRLAENTTARAIDDLNRDALDLVESIESAYWRLHLAWQAADIAEWLLAEGTTVRDVFAERRDFDTRLAQYAEAVAVVEQRRANLIRARRTVRVASDALKALLDDQDLTIGSEVVLRPSDDFVDSPVEYNLRDSIVLALANRPEIRRAMLAVDDADINLDVARNALLPKLDLSAEVAWFGQDPHVGHAYENASDAEFIDYVVGLAFEYPLGNRGAEAGERRARLLRAQSMLAYRQTIKQVVLDVKGALRDVVTNYELIEATRSFRIAQAENLRALLVEEEMLRGLTPEFLNLKYQRQDTLASARRQELEALADFDTALSRLARAMGTSLSEHGIEIEIVRGIDDAYDLVVPADGP